MKQHGGKYGGILFVVFLSTWGLVLGGATNPASAQQPITISILDNGGDWASTGVIIENYKKAFPDKATRRRIKKARTSFTLLSISTPPGRAEAGACPTG